MDLSVILLPLLFVISINVDLLSAARHLLDPPAAAVTVPGAAANAPAASPPAALPSDANLTAIANLLPGFNFSFFPADVVAEMESEIAASPPVMSAGDAAALMLVVAQLQNISLDIPDFSLPPLPPVELPSYPVISLFGQATPVPPFLNFTTMFSTDSFKTSNADENR